MWDVATWLLAVVLTVVSVLAGVRWRTDVVRERAAVFETTASAVASSVATTLRRQTDLTAVEQTLVGLNPGLTNADFKRWFDELGAAKHYPGSLGFGFVERVPADQLDAFAAVLAADPTKDLTVKGKYSVFPGGHREEYCQLRLVVWLGPTGQLQPTLDYCAPSIPLFGPSPTAQALASARDTGKLTLASPVSLYPGEMFAFAPVYAGGSIPGTVAERRQQLIGWVAGTFDGKAILTAAQAGHQNLNVEVFGDAGGQHTVLASVGSKPSGHVASITVPVDDAGTWSVRVAGTTVGGGASADVQGLVVGGLGVAISWLICGVIQVLLRSRRRALRLVHERTEELRHRATHDDLTGLPNRALIMDRLDQLLHRSRRYGTAAAVMFIDLDGFKDVNDTYGHAVGDALLRAVAGRLSGTLRGSDSAGRLGGDEFVVLVEGLSADDGPADIADRLLESLHAPYTLDELPEIPLDVRASIGIAMVGTGTPDDVLREADIALYDAKAAGKSQFVVFSG